MKTEPSPTAQALVRDLLTREVADTEDPKAIGAAIQRLSFRVSLNLRHALGDDGHNALIQRALARTQPDHPILTDAQLFDESGVTPDSVVASINAHGVPLVTAAITSVLATLVDILSGLIGADMVLNLIDHDVHPSTSPTAGTHNDHA